MIRAITYGLLCCFFVGQVLSQVPTPAAEQPRKTLIRYATAHLGNGEKLDNAYIVIEGRELSMVANGNSARVNVLDYDTIIDAEGKHVYPGFIVMDSRLGLVEIGAVRATHDYDETGDFLPNVRALPAFNTESKIIPTVRTNGVLMAQIAPVGGTISGSSSCVHFDGWEWKDATVKADEGIYLDWPDRYKYDGHWSQPASGKADKKYSEKAKAIQEYFQEAKAYCQQDSVVPKNQRFEAMRRLFSGDQRLYVRVNWARDILDVVQFYRSSGIDKIAIVGGAEAHLVTTELRENKIPVVIDRVHKLPAHQDDPLDQPFTLAKDLEAEGVTVAIATSGDMEAMISRNLPFQLGTAVHHGLDYEKAIQAVTLNPAIMMGVDGKYGSLESGKIATLFISSGDALDIATNNVETAFVEGQLIDLDNHQKRLYRKFAKKQGIEVE